MHQHVVVLCLRSLSLKKVQQRQLHLLGWFLAACKAEVFVELAADPFEAEVAHSQDVYFVVAFLLVEPQSKTVYLCHLLGLLDECLQVDDLVDCILDLFLDALPDCILQLLMDDLCQLNGLSLHVLVDHCVVAVEN